MPCKGCSNSLCNCFSASTQTVTTVGNGNSYSPLTFRPLATPFPRPFGHLQGATSQPLDGAPYTLFPSTTVEDIDAGGNMVVGDGRNLRAPVDGLYVINFTCKVGNTAVDNLNDNFSLRKNGTTFLSTATYGHLSSVPSGTTIFVCSTTLVDLNQNDTIDLYVERVAGVGNVDVSYAVINGVNMYIQLWGFWIAGPILP